MSLFKEILNFICAVFPVLRIAPIYGNILNRKNIVLFSILRSCYFLTMQLEMYLEPCQESMMEIFLISLFARKSYTSRHLHVQS